jgi:hypothetical protein
VFQALLYNAFGEPGLMAQVIVELLVLSTLVFFVVKEIGADDEPLVLVVAVAAVAGVSFLAGTSRPAIATAILITAVVLVLEKFKNTRNLKLLATLPLFSIAQSNIHSTFWMALMAVIVFYFLFDMVGKLSSKHTLSKEKRNKRLLAWLLAIVASVIAGFVNPYGYEAIFQPFYTIGMGDYYSILTEATTPEPLMLVGLVILPFAMICVLLFSRKKIIASPIGVLYVCTVVATCVALRGAVFEMLFWLFYTSEFYASNNNAQSEKFRNPPAEKINSVNSARRLPSVLSVILFACGVGYCCWHYSLPDSFTIYDDCVVLEEFGNEGLLDKNETEGKTILSVTSMTGCEVMAEMYGMIPYNDDRFETYNPNVNGGNNLLAEFFDELCNGDEESFNNVVDKYGFDYILVTMERDDLLEYVSNNENYSLVGTTANYEISENNTILSGKEVWHYALYKRDTVNISN